MPSRKFELGGAARPMRGFYAILDAPASWLDDPEALERRARQLLAAQPCCLQLRAKGSSAGALAAAARSLVRLCRGGGVPFCVNDRLDVALSVGADVVHLGQDDLPLAEALRVRAAFGRPDLLIGFSTHDRAQAVAAAAGGADYIGFGPVFTTGSKTNPDPVVGLDQLADVCRTVSVPVVAIGGIALEAVGSVAAAGASAAALIAAISTASDPTAAGLQIRAAFQAPSASA
ncbi:MAG TPA: thiamine phosphate synthase [Polyangia bacterium]|nr:thiamine phosphate synthase [Polyangia bacterium]